MNSPTQPPSHEEVQQLPELVKWLREEADANDKSGAGFDPIVIKWVDKLRGWAAMLESILADNVRLSGEV